MIGGHKTRAALSAFAASGAVLLSAVPASAADLGGGCCADLEERIAELEATTARKGNRKVSLTISGQVNKAVMFWDDGIESNAYVVDNDSAQTRFRFLGKAKIQEGWEAGYLLELGLDTASSDGVTQFDPSANEGGALGGGTAGGTTGIEVRHARWYLKSKEFGTVWVGQGSGAQDDLYKWGNVSKTTFSDPELHYNGRMLLRTTQGGTIQTSGTATNARLNWDGVASNLDLSRTNNVRYDSPEFAGFVASASWGSDDVWDMALRYEQKFGNFHVRAGLSYTEDTESPVNGTINRGDETKDFVASAGIAEKTTGLYVWGAGGQRDIDDVNVNIGPSAAGVTVDNKAYYLYGQLGIARDFISIGGTNIHFEYGYYDGWAQGQRIRNGTEIGLDSASNWVITNSEVTRWGFGVTQNIKAADMDLYALFTHYEADLGLTNRASGAAQNLDTEDWFAVVTGARILF